MARALAGVDAIIHAGDLTDLCVLDELRRVAPVVAVRGNHDRKGRLPLPVAARVEAGGAVIGVAHGDRGASREIPAALLSVVTGRPQLGGMLEGLARRFPDCDCVVFGHIHLPVLTRRRGVLLFSPGAVYAPEADPFVEKDSMRSRAAMTFRARLPTRLLRPAVGILEIEDGRVTPRVVLLREPLRP